MENNALLWACGNNKDVIESLLKAGADPKSKNFIGSTTLHIFASTSTHKDVLPLLLSTGVDINVKSDHGRTPMASALHNKKSSDMLDLLIKAGADVNVVLGDYGNILTSSVRAYVAHENNAYLLPHIQNLIARKVDVNIPDKDGKTALHYALAAKHMDLVDMLLQAGAKADSK